MGLSEDHRRTIAMALYGGMSYRQVASRLDIPESEVRARMRSGLKQVSREMGAREGAVIRMSWPAAPLGDQPRPPLPAA